MQQLAPAAWARQGTVEDIITLVALYGQLMPTARRRLWSDAANALAEARVKGAKTKDGAALSAGEWLSSIDADTPADHDRIANLIVAIRRLGKQPLIGATSEVVTLMRVYEELQVSRSGDGSLLVGAGRALAAQHVLGGDDPDKDAEEVEDWLARLADDTYPHHDDEARLLGMISDVGLRVDEFIFSDGMLSAVLCGWEGEFDGGDSAYAGYRYTRSTIDPPDQPPTAADYFQIDVSKAAFTEVDDDGSYFDEDAWKAEVDRQCIVRFAELVARWRGAFWTALLAAVEGQPRRDAGRAGEGTK